MLPSLLKIIISNAVEFNASDIHLTPDSFVHFRVDGKLRMIENLAVNSQEILEFIDALIVDKEDFDISKISNYDFSFSFGKERFRGHLYRECKKLSIAIRRLENEIKTIIDLGLPNGVSSLAKFRDGLVLVTGPTGSGKSTTIASLINEINLTQNRHIVTIEDPVEYIYPPAKSLIHQREIKSDVSTFASAVKASLREDPDVVLVGEMRDNETMSAAIRVAETGHLVFSTLHTGDTSSAIGRIIGSFPAEEHPALLQQMSQVLRAIVAQHLLQKVDGGRVVVTEILIVNNAVANLIRQNKTEGIYTLIESGSSYGMRTLEQSLAEHVLDKTISLETALGVATYPDILKNRVLR